MEREQVVKWLGHFSEMMREIEITEERYITLKEKSVSVSAPIMEGMPHGTGTITDKTARYIVQLEEIGERLRRQHEEADKVYREIEAAINKIKGNGWPDKRAVLRMQYLDLFTWSEIAEALYIKNENFYEKQDSYITRAFRVRDRALAELAALLPELEAEERENEHCKI